MNFEIKTHLATLSKTPAGYSTELNRTSFNGMPAKLDIRTWHNGQPLKGICLSDDEAWELLQALSDAFGIPLHIDKKAAKMPCTRADDLKPARSPGRAQRADLAANKRRSRNP